MLKLKPWRDAEGIVTGVKEEFTKDGKAKGTLGALLVQSAEFTVELGTGFTRKQRAALWEFPPIGQLAKFKFASGSDYKQPRHPVFLGLRAEFDT